VPIGDNDPKDKDLCLYPIKLKTGQHIARCMDMITVDDVARAISRYMDNLDYKPVMPTSSSSSTPEPTPEATPEAEATQE
jgi:hypothetical protein